MSDSYVPRTNPGRESPLVKDFWEKENQGKLVIGTSCFGDYLSSLSQKYLDRFGELFGECDKENCDPEISAEVIGLTICLFYLETGKPVSLDEVGEKMPTLSIAVGTEILRRKGLVSVDLSWNIMKISDKSFGESSCAVTDLGAKVAEKMFGKKNDK